MTIIASMLIAVLAASPAAAPHVFNFPGQNPCAPAPERPAVGQCVAETLADSGPVTIEACRPDGTRGSDTGIVRAGERVIVDAGRPVTIQACGNSVLSRWEPPVRILYCNEGDEAAFMPPPERKMPTAAKVALGIVGGVVLWMLLRNDDDHERAAPPMMMPPCQGRYCGGD